MAVVTAGLILELQDVFRLATNQADVNLYDVLPYLFFVFVIAGLFKITFNCKTRYFLHPNARKVQGL